MVNEDRIFWHNNTLIYTARIVQQALAEMNIEPPHSPDLNPIKNLWALLKAKIYKIRPDLVYMLNNDQTKEILVATAQQAWDELDIQHLQHLSETMPNRVRAIIESQGWYTPY
ncbi:Transposable element tc3 transposase [Penicillium hispanicum]|uniref:Transposable element tc3 transposase n=1 Tax=Penicillium hispanicum TaxID=1080232 RepID=UPI0025412510|nr:Transposable element tc3 transposase [Penicillium hispanicum]KAJ5591462.1 Transposable element tc3 transposase [Penicillium hispanicum]